jgi:hypothetical protein
MLRVWLFNLTFFCMKKIYSPYLLILFFSACTPAKVSYVGSTNTPTQKVDVFVDESAIKRKYEVIGKGYVEPNWRGQLQQERILEKAIEKAKKNGADAVFFKETYIVTSGSNISTQSRADSVGKSLITNSNTAVSPVYGYFHKELLFLKYN